MAAPDVLLLYMHSSSKTTNLATRESQPSGRQPDSGSPCSPLIYWKARGGGVEAGGRWVSQVKGRELFSDTGLTLHSPSLRLLDSGQLNRRTLIHPNGRV